MNYFLFAAFWLVAASSSWATPTQEIVTLDTGSGKLEGTLLTADSADTKTIALIIAGSGPTDRDGNNPAMTNNSLKMLADELSKIGVSSLRYDKRGVGKSKGSGLNESELRFEHYVNDASGWVDYLSQQDRFDKLVVIGHSEGSLIGMIASQTSHVDKFVSIAGVGQPVDQTIREQLKAQPAIVLEQSGPILDKLLQGETVKNVPKYLYSLFRPSVQDYMISWFKYDPQIEIAKLDKPVLVVQGASDIQVSLNDADKLAAANTGAEKAVIQKMNHIFKEASLDRLANLKTYNQPDLPMMPELAQTIGEFVTN